MNSTQLDELTFEQALGELERVVRALEDGQTSLEQALSQYETGISLLKRCYGQLTQAEQRIRLLSGLDENGAPILQAFDHKATASPTTPLAQARRRRKPPEEPELSM